MRVEVQPRSRHRPGITSCGGPGCKTCPILFSSEIITSHSNGSSHQIRTPSTCKSSNVIYVIQCRKCGLQYVGETGQSLNQRMNSHRSDIKKVAEDKPISQHYNLPNHSANDLSVTVVEKIFKDDTWLRRLRETFWIKHLDTLRPGGLNLDAGIPI